VYDRTSPEGEPRRYTVSAGDSLRDFWPAKRGDRYHLAAYGPNGYLVEQAGTVAEDAPRVAVQGAERKALQLVVHNPSEHELTLSCKEIYTGWEQKAWSVPAMSEKKLAIPLEGSSGWFDLEIRDPQALQRRFAGHLEDGAPSVSDPLLAVEA
jgi:phospholipase C